MRKRQDYSPAQTSFIDEIIVDNFAGGGGASTGIELAAGRPVAIAINHDPDAILLHKTNHPYTEHLQASVWDVDPEEVCKGRPVGLAWFSPDCKHFSKAKGSALVDRNIRGLAWIVLRWAGTVRPRVIILENVEEFVTWGPVRKGSAIITALPYLAESALSIVTSLGEAILSTDWIQLGTDTINSLRESLDIAAGEILGTDGNIVQSVIDAIGSKLPELLENGGIMVNQLVDGIFGALPSLVDSALDLCVNFINMLVSNLPNILNTGKSILLNIVDGIRQSFPSIIVSAGDAVVSLISGLVTHLPDILAAGIDLIVSLVTGIGNAYPDIIAAAGQVAKKLLDTIKNTDWLSLGKNIIQGLINGIGAMGNALWSAAKSIARSALNAIKSALGIASPSKVMRDQVGKWIPSGVAVGIEANTKPLTEALHDMSVLTTDSLQTDMNLNNAISGIAAVPVRVGGQIKTNSTTDTAERIASILEDIDDSNTAILDKTMSALGDILKAIYGIRLTDDDVYNAWKRASTRNNVMTGVLL